jgi:hypothetical protein
MLEGSYHLLVSGHWSDSPEPVVIDVLWGKVATKVGTSLAKSMNLVPTFPHGPQIVKL